MANLPSDHLYRPGVKDPISVRGPELMLLAHIRDEAHRFAISHHRKARRKVSLRSLLDSVSGIGPKRRKNLLIRFGSIEGIRDASDEDLRSAGIPDAVTADLRRVLGVDLDGTGVNDRAEQDVDEQSKRNVDDPNGET